MGGSISVCQRYLRIILKIGSVGVLSELNDNLNLYLQTGWVQQNNEPVYQADDLLLYNITLNVLIFKEKIQRMFHPERKSRGQTLSG